MTVTVSTGVFLSPVSVLVTVKKRFSRSKEAPSAATRVLSFIWKVTGIRQLAVRGFPSKLAAGLVFAVSTARPPRVPFPYMVSGIGYLNPLSACSFSAFSMMSRKKPAFRSSSRDALISV